MSRRRELEHHRHSLAEIREIMNSMKTLAYLETRKLNRFLPAQHAVIQNIELVATDFLAAYPALLPASTTTQDIHPVYLIIGSERGFCGDFNHTLLYHLTAGLESNPQLAPVMLVVGSKLQMLLEEDDRVTAVISGASVVEEVLPTLHQIVNELSTLQQGRGPLTLYALYHGVDSGIVMQALLPPFRHCIHQAPPFSQPPELNLEPREFLVELTDHYLFAALYEMLYTSLMAENQLRVSHLTGAVRHLDDESVNLTRQFNALRQEEIIEEIEVILLSATSLDNKPRK